MFNINDFLLAVRGADSRYLCLLILMILNAPHFVSGRDGAPASTSTRTPAQIASGILSDLNHESYERREDATGKVAGLPFAVLPFLEKALVNKEISLEVRGRLSKGMPQLRRRTAYFLWDKRARSEVEWYGKALSESYARGSRRSPKWDALCLKAFPLAALLWAGSPALDRSEEDRLVDLCRQAYDLDVEDGLIVYVYARIYEDWVNTKLEQKRKLFWMAAEKMMNTDYRGVWKFLALGRGGLVAFEDGAKRFNRNRARKMLKAADRMFASILEIPEMPSSLMFRCTQVAVDVRKRLAGKSQDGLDAILEMVRKSNKPAIAFVIQARQALDEAKGVPLMGSVDYYSSSVFSTDKEEQRFKKLLVLAEAACASAWMSKPRLAAAPKLMLETLLWMENKDAVRFRLWYDRAMSQNPNDMDACRMMLEFLERADGDQSKNLLTFGRACLKRATGASCLPFILIKAHRKVAIGKRARRTYWAQVEVWDEIQPVFENYLKKYPYARHERSLYVLKAWSAKKSDIARRELTRLGSNFRRQVLSARSLLIRIKRDLK